FEIVGRQRELRRHVATMLRDPVGIDGSLAGAEQHPLSSVDDLALVEPELERPLPRIHGGAFHVASSSPHGSEGPPARNARWGAGSVEGREPGLVDISRIMGGTREGRLCGLSGLRPSSWCPALRAAVLRPRAALYDLCAASGGGSSGRLRAHQCGMATSERRTAVRWRRTCLRRWVRA